MDGVALPTLHGFRTTFLIATGAVALGLVFALLLPGGRPTARPRIGAADKTSVRGSAAGRAEGATLRCRRSRSPARRRSVAGDEPVPDAADRGAPAPRQQGVRAAVDAEEPKVAPGLG
ncbi:hypothetical protein GCM10010103_55240 [Streptomyces paradoxus]